MQHTSTQLLPLLAEHISRPIFVFALASRRFLFVNKAFEQEFGLTADSGQHPDQLRQLVHAEDQEYTLEALEKLLQEKEPRELEFRVQLQGEAQRWLCVSLSVAEDADEGQLLIGSVEDVTASRQYNDYLKKYAAKKNSALHVLAHDLAGPMGIIHSLSEELTEEVKAYGSQGLEQLIGIISKTSANSLTMIRGLISQEFLETTGVDVIKRRVNMVEKFEEMLAQYRESASELDLSFQFHTSGSNIFAALDDVKFMQAMNNLVSNAIKFTPKGGVVSTTLEEREHSVLVKVADNGVGIPAKYHEVLFDKFTKARRPGLNGEATTGLGMSIIKTIVEWHNGKIWFESEEGKGTTFYIEVPKE